MGDEKATRDLPPLHAERLLDDLTYRMSDGVFPKGKAYDAVGVFCPVCGAERRMMLIPCFWSKENGYRPSPPVLYEMTCLQCSTWATVTVYNGPTGVETAIHWPKLAGLSTPNTPDSVAYYLDQAGRCDGAGANSAAAAMYRAALEHLLYEQGYTSGMLHAKIEALVEEIEDGNAPKWARDLDPTYLDTIKQIGNGAIHTNGGDVTKQAALDRGVLDALRVTMSELLEVVYERPAKEAERRAKLKAAADHMKAR